jgi:hypothetical protein
MTPAMVTRRILATCALLAIWSVACAADDGTNVCLRVLNDAECTASPAKAAALEPLPALLTTLSEQRCEVVRLKDWYGNHARSPWLLFRVFGALTILLSVAVPYLATLDGRWRSTVLPIVTLSIAALTGMTAFFQWQTQWAGFRSAELNLRFALTQWNVRIAEACSASDPATTSKIAIDATRSLLASAQSTVSSETGHYFDAVRTPELQPERTSP